MSNTTHAGSSSLRHSSSHRKAVARTSSNRPAFVANVIGFREPGPLDHLLSVRDLHLAARQELSDWVLGRHISSRVTLVCSNTDTDTGGMRLRVALAIETRSISLPANVGGWSLRMAKPGERTC